jgi:DNA polymerase III delta prime subunit
MEVVKDQYVWVEKYRPQTVENVIIPQTIKGRIKAYLSEGQIPNLMFYSPSPGTGKTTLARAICNDLGIRPLFINGSVTNSVVDIRTTIIDYATTVSLTGNHKVIVLDECERLSAQAQEALKGVIEDVAKNCRFILTTNSKAKIIEPIRSRCMEVDFIFSESDQLAVSAFMFQRAFDILTHEGVVFKPAVLAELVQTYSPDNRKLLQVLQDCSRNGPIDEGVLKQIDTYGVENLVEMMKKKEFTKILQWCRDNENGLTDDFYGLLYESMKSVIETQSLPQLILILGEEQKVHTVVPDMFLHAAQLCTKIMMDVQFKG